MRPRPPLPRLRASTHASTALPALRLPFLYPCRRTPAPPPRRLPASPPLRHSAHYSTHTPDDEPTIYALSTPPGTSAIAIIRISGPGCLSIYHALTHTRTPPRPRYAHLHKIRTPAGAILDPGALVLFFPGPHSHTGTDLLELHLHGSPAITRAVLATLASLARPAAPGEFTRRAFLNNRLSLPEVEILSDTLAAVTEQQRVRAVRDGRALTAKYEAWREALVAARGELEAILDFSEDQAFEQSPAELLGNVSGMVARLKGLMRVYVANAMKGELLRAGIQIAIVGAPNVGKSSLLNRVLEREAAIVSDEAGTTRDVLDAQVDIGGFLCVVADTAGLREGAGRVEAEGIRRARERAERADLVVGVLDAGRWEEGVEEVAELLDGKESCLLLNKIDLIPPAQREELRKTVAGKVGLPVENVLALSATADDGSINELLTHLAARFAKMTEADGGLGMEESVAATERQRVLVEECLRYLERYEEVVGEGGGEGEVDFVLAAEELRGAAGALAKILGRGGDVEEVLGVVFERFCVGK